jgi:hypothetical protein
MDQRCAHSVPFQLGLTFSGLSACEIASVVGLTTSNTVLVFADDEGMSTPVSKLPLILRIIYIKDGQLLPSYPQSATPVSFVNPQ